MEGATVNVQSRGGSDPGLQRVSGEVRVEPVLCRDVFPPADLAALRRYIDLIGIGRMEYQEGFGRHIIGGLALGIWGGKLLPLAKEVFAASAIKPSYCMYARYSGAVAALHPHRDDNACTYTIDFCLSQKTPWGLFVEGKEYFLEPNSALCFMGNDQTHWRGPFPDPATNVVEMVFFHFVPHDHWYFTKGPDYVNVIRGSKSGYGVTENGEPGSSASESEGS